jgi:hypothetical protein
MMNDFMNLLFKVGIPYDAERNEFSVRPEDMARIETQQRIDQENEQWMNNAHLHGHDYL